MPDHYTYPGTEVLVNIPGYTDPAAWKEAETAVIGLRVRELVRTPISGDFDLAHLQAIHARLVEGFYTWGGQLRDTNTGPGGTGIAHCLPEFIPDEADRVFGALAGMDYLKGRDRAGFSAGLAWTWGETTAIHPFRDVNTRSQFTLFNQLAVEAGWVIDWNQIDPHVFAHARTVAIYRDPDGLEALLHPALIPVASIRADDLPERMEQAAAEFTRPRPRRDVDALDRELRAALQRRANQVDPDPSFGPPPRRGPGPQDRGLGL
ncbi:Fic family protein [Brevibacterium luteolum]|uniref:Fic/DOC family protein n=1 Tax=Brevibacterium luteolum TaxID=199591 RepID=UPI001C21FB46|nr:Fic family protein [Brevibacterium luteolum]MBU8579919.1 Fic family protein [Brevibacterium luteolum]